jgi:acyl carrier protein
VPEKTPGPSTGPGGIQNEDGIRDTLPPYIANARTTARTTASRSARFVSQKYGTRDDLSNARFYTSALRIGRTFALHRVGRPFARDCPREYRLNVNVEAGVLRILESVLNLQGRSGSFSKQTPLLGSIPELDSMAVVSVLTALEERFGFVIEDDEVDGQTFATVGSLVSFVSGKLSA